MWALVSPHPETSKAELYTDSWEQERGPGATSITHTGGMAVGPLPSQQRTPAAFTMEETNGQHGCQGLPAEFTHFAPQVFTFTDTSHLDFFYPPHIAWDPHCSHPGASVVAQVPDTRLDPHG